MDGTKPEFLAVWLALGRKNPWIRLANDPPFDERSFYGCRDADELTEKLDHGNWSLGSAFYLDDLCFVNQIDGGSEWLTIKAGVAFESISCGHMIERDRNGWDNMLADLQAATLEQCRALEYAGAGAKNYRVLAPPAGLTEICPGVARADTQAGLRAFLRG